MFDGAGDMDWPADQDRRVAEITQDDKRDHLAALAEPGCPPPPLPAAEPWHRALHGWFWIGVIVAALALWLAVLK